MTFTAWTEMLVAELRRMIPEVQASRRGRSAEVRYLDKSAQLADEGAYVTVRIEDRVAFTPEKNPGTARVIARSLATHFDVERWGRG